MRILRTRRPFAGLWVVVALYFVPGGTALGQTGACCFPEVFSPGCVVTDSAGCASIQGEFLGAGTVCAPGTCSGACCTDNRPCFEGEFWGDCLMVSGGDFQGVGSTCELNCPSPLGTAFTYQGQLKVGGVPVNGTADFQFTLWDAPGSGDPPIGARQIGGVQNISNMAVVNGLFAVEPDFGAAAFAGGARWLQIAVRSPAGSGMFTTLGPRQEIMPSPYAGHSLDAADGSPTNALLVDNDGKVGIGTAVPDAKVHVSGAEGTMHGKGAALALSNTAPGGANWYLRTGATGTATPAGGFSIADDNGYWLAITNTGNVGVGTTAPTTGFKLDVIGNVRCTSLTETSSRALKRDIAPIANALEKLSCLEGVSFAWTDEPGGDRDLGLIAEEVAEVFPELVTWSEDGSRAAGLKYGHLTAVAVEAIKELDAKVKAKDAEIAELKTRMLRMEQTLEQLSSHIGKEKG